MVIDESRVPTYNTYCSGGPIDGRSSFPRVAVGSAVIIVVMNVWRKLMRILGIAGRTPRRRKARALFVGLNNAGKSTLLNRLKSDREQVSRKMITPTVGFTAGQFVCEYCRTWPQ